MFGGYREIRNLETKVSELERENKSLKSRDESRENIIRDLRRSHDSVLYELRRDHSREVEEVQHRLDNIEREHEAEIDRINNEVHSRIDEIDANADSRIAQVRSESSVAIKEAEADAEVRVREAKSAAKAELVEKLEEVRNSYSVDIVELETRLAREVAKTAEAKALAEERQTTVKNLENQIQDYKEFVQFVLNKVPNVDLTKFNINVEVPPAEVHVVGGQKGGEQKK